MTPTYLEPSHAFSLLWPGQGSPARAIALSRQAIHDLDLETVVAGLCPAEQYRRPVKETCTACQLIHSYFATARQSSLICWRTLPGASFHRPVAGPGELPSGELPADGYSYQVEFRPPLGRSYAARIAAQYGITKEQLLAMLTARGVLDPGGDPGRDETANASNDSSGERTASS